MRHSAEVRRARTGNDARHADRLEGRGLARRAVVATLALYLPSSLLCYGVLKATNAHREKKWHRAAREGLAPVGTGLVIAGVITIFRLSGGGFLGAVIAGASAAILILAPRFPTLPVLWLGAPSRHSRFGSWFDMPDSTVNARLAAPARLSPEPNATGCSLNLRHGAHST